ncbi:ABC transporter permease [Aestuariirhabdus litorea]|uniref:Transport permease protein n=1 Tax=Aestuariirhabdus litorea TaxID=2528527 RepID=A0A3P3VRF7_9GAMM|nr:ABC transporter permease [Aestuariirhabdus litorea]RRJ84568.1 ABC transporter permease [Aestuariirhabdus litorea]RWW97794.1 ABC transporter permease [Endozoicomonadaceae bacterium GTF-13]
MRAADAWIAFMTIAIKEVRRFLRIWPQTLLPPAITMLLYFVIFGSVIGSRIGEMGGFSYMEYVVPGLIMMSVITNSYGNVASSFYSNKFQRSVEEILVSPVPDYLMLAGFVCGGVIRGLLVGSIVTLLSLTFTSLPMHSVGVTILAVVMTAVLFSLGGFINALYANSFDDISIIPTFVLTPLTYLGGVFYSINVLPDFWAGLSHLNPILYMVNTFRYGILGYSDGVPVVEALALLALLTVIVFCFTLFLLRRGTGLRH